MVRWVSNHLVLMQTMLAVARRMSLIKRGPEDDAKVSIAQKIHVNGDLSYLIEMVGV